MTLAELRSALARLGGATLSIRRQIGWSRYDQTTEPYFGACILLPNGRSVLAEGTTIDRAVESALAQAADAARPASGSWCAVVATAASLALR